VKSSSKSHDERSHGFQVSKVLKGATRYNIPGLGIGQAMSACVNTRICFATRHPGALRRSQNPRKDQTTVPKAQQQLSDKKIAAYSKHTWKSTAVLLFWAGWSKAKKNYRIFIDPLGGRPA
jgi:hypothetical protein